MTEELKASFSDQFTDDPDLIFKNIDGEIYRAYTFPNGVTIEIRDPVAVAVKVGRLPFGGSAHRVIDKEGIAHYIPHGWLLLKWKNSANIKPCRW